MAQVLRYKVVHSREDDGSSGSSTMVRNGGPRTFTEHEAFSINWPEGGRFSKYHVLNQNGSIRTIN